MKYKCFSIILKHFFVGIEVISLASTLRAAVQPRESLLFGPGSGREPKTNGDLQTTSQVVGYISVGGARHHALFTVFGQSPTHGMDLVVFDVDSRTMVKRFQIPDVAGSSALAYGSDQLYFATSDKPKLFKYDTTQINTPPVLLAEVPFSVSV